MLRRPVLVLVGVPAVLVIAAAIDVVVSYVPAVQALRAGRDAAQQASDLLRRASTHLDTATLAQVTQLLDEARSDFGERSAVLESGALGTVADHLPFAGTQIDAVRALRQAGAAAVDAGEDLAPLVRQVIDGTTADTALARLTSIAATGAAQLGRVRADLDRLDAALAATPSDDELLGPLRDARDTLQRQAGSLDGTLRPALALAGALPAAIGPGTHTYLLLLTNPAEERPGGGFIGAVGQVTFRDGRLTEATFRLSDFANATVRSLPAPRALDQYLFHGTPWQLSDANWSPDFDTSAAQVATFYRLATGVQTDGVIEVDDLALGDVLRVLGPVDHVTGDGTLLQLNRIANEPGQPGKSFLEPFGAAMVSAVTRADAGRLPALAGALADAIRTKHLLLDFADQSLEKLVPKTLAAPGDSVAVVDANLSAGKEDLYVQRGYALDAHVSRDGRTVTDRVTLAYSNPGPSDPRDQPLVASGGGAYRDYLRVEIPAGATVDDLTISRDGGAAQPLSPDSVEPDQGHTAVGVFVVIPRGHTATLVLDEHSTLPTSAYRLTWDKQANALDWPVKVSLVGASGQTKQWSGLLDSDRTWGFD
jgi:hypothetical protein